MRIAYLVNRYPTVSHSFIRREIAAVERLGHEVDRYSVRPAPPDLPDARDRDELARTVVILAAPWWQLFAAALATAARRPGGFVIALRRAARMAPPSLRGRLASWAYVVEACWLGRAMVRRGATHLHAHFGTNPAAVARLVHLLFAFPYSFTIHGPDEFDAPKQLDLTGKAEDASFVVTISDYGRSQMLRWTPLALWPKIVVVRCGLDRPADPPEPAPAERDGFCCVARLAPQKGLPILVEAVALLRDRDCPVRVTVIGDGDLRESLARMIAAERLDGAITLAGALDGAAVQRAMRAATVFVLPSFAEGLPVVLMEALAEQTPVIATQVAGVAELVDGGCGWLIRPGSAAALADAMAQALATSREARDALGDEGRRRVRRLHDVDREAALLVGHIADPPRCVAP